MNNFIRTYNLEIQTCVFPITHTYSSYDGQSRSKIDHFCTTNNYLSVESCDVMERGDNLSNHHPLFINCTLRFDVVHNIVVADVVPTPKTRWHNVSNDDINEYRHRLNQSLSSSAICAAPLVCSNNNCTSTEHCNQITVLYNSIIDGILTSQAALPQSSGCQKDEGKNLAGWNTYVAPARRDSIFWHKLWVEAGRPPTGVVADIMRRTRRDYHKIVRQLRVYQNQLKRDNFLSHSASNFNDGFWRACRNELSVNVSLPIINGLSD